MPYTANIYRVLIASPSDVANERLAIPEVIYGWNTLHSLDFKAVLLPVKWETHATPQMGERPQAIINKQLVSKSDILIGVFWTRLGTPTGEAESGSVEEINEFRAKGKPVLLYFSNAPVIVNSVDLKQYDKLKEFKEKCFKEGLVSVYDSLADFREKLHRHLIDTVRGLTRPEGRKYDIANLTDAFSPTQVLKSFMSQYDAFLSLLEIEWVAERDKTPAGLDKGKYIFQRASDELLNFRAQAAFTLYPELAGVVDDILKQMSSLQQHQLTLGGGEYKKFWEAGDGVLTRMKDVPRIGRHLLKVKTPRSFEVHFLHPRNSTTLTADVSPQCTREEAITELTAVDGTGAFLSTQEVEQSYKLVVARTQQVIAPKMTFEEAGVIDGDTVEIHIDGSTPVLPNNSFNPTPR